MNLINRSKNILSSEKNNLKEIWIRIKKRDFSGNTGLAVKNSIYQFSTNIISKIGSLIFMIILARLLMPNLFGLYSLALSTIGLVAIISDLGISGTLIKFISKQLSLPKKKQNILGYYNYLSKLKFVLTIVSSLVLVLSAYWISNFYNKPIFYALLAGGLYIFIISFVDFFDSFYRAFNNFKKTLIKESIFQVLRLIIIPLIIVYSLTFSNEILFLNIILGLSFCLFISLLFLLTKKPVLTGNPLIKKQKIEINRFIFSLTIIAFSTVLFSYVDRVMLGYYVTGEFIGYYSVAFSLINSVLVFLGFSSALFPIFSRLKQKSLETGLKKSIKIIIPLSIVAVIIIILLAQFIIKIIYGSAYLNSINILKTISLLLISDSISGIFSAYFASKGNVKILSKFFLLSAILNVILNYIFITILIKQSPLAATIGVTIATIISRWVYMGILVGAWFRGK